MPQHESCETNKAVWRYLRPLILFDESAGFSLLNLMAATLQKGDRNSEVIILQDFLLRLNLIGVTDITGEFDAKTEKAVRRFQNFNKMPVTGVVTDRVWEMLYQKAKEAVR